MESRSNPIKSIFNTTATTLKTLFLPTATAATTYLSHAAIQVTRELDASSLKDTLKNQFAKISSTVNVVAIAASSFTCIETLISTGAWAHFSASQRLSICTCLVVALSNAGYSLGVFGVEQHTLAAGLSATASVLSFNIANNLTSFFALKNEIARQDNDTPTERTHLVPQQP